jgi:hypothetical protein
MREALSMLFERDEVRRYAGHTRQLFGIKSYTFDEGPEKGVKAFEIDTGAGLRFTVLPDRCLDISYAQMDYRNVSYIAKPGIVSPQYYNPAGDEWLRSFGGGLLTTCGLTQVGFDGSTDVGLHGRVGNTPAYDVCHSQGWVDGRYEMTVAGKVREAVLYGENVVLERRITAFAGGTSLRVCDTFVNEGREAFALLLLYHCNFGYPLLDEGTRLIADIRRTVARDEQQELLIPQATHYIGPEKGGDAQVFFHDIEPDADGYVTVKLVNEQKKLGVRLKYRKDALPCFAQWKNGAEQDYVTGLEPCVSLPVGRQENLRRNLYRLLAPGEAFETSLEFGVAEFNNEENSR